MDMSFADAEKWNVLLAFDEVHSTETGYRVASEGYTND